MGCVTSPALSYSGALFPDRLHSGDVVGLIAPGSSVPKERIDRAVETVGKLGLVPRLGKYIHEANGYLAGTDKQRLDDLHTMFVDPEVRAVWCLRGGYGCTRLLPDIDYGLIKENPKIFAGYSDITALHLAFYKETGLITYHSPVAVSEPTDYTINRFEEIVFSGKKCVIRLAEEHLEEAFEIHTIVEGKVQGRLTGGNLSLLAALAGTKWSPDYKDKLVFIEDIGEKPYRIDRMLVQLFQATDLREAAGIIFGQFNDCEAEDGEKSQSLKETLAGQFRNFDGPVFYGFSFGHIDNQCTLPIGVNARFDTREKVLHLLEAPTI